MKSKFSIKEFIIINIGMVMVAGGLYYFLNPNNLATGGAFGIAVVLSSFFPKLNVGLLMMMINGILFIVAFLFIGSGFGAKTIYASLGISGMIWLFGIVTPIKKSVTDDILIDLIFGVLISGVGMGVVLNQNASTGGTDIVAKVLNKFFHIGIGKGLFLSDFFITLIAGLRFGPKTGMYALLGVILNSYVIDSVIEGLGVCKEVTIISDRGKEIKKFIMGDLERGVTVYDAKGAYTGEIKEVIITVMSQKEFIRLRRFIREADPKAFITVNNVHEVLGEGFKDIVD